MYNKELLLKSLEVIKEICEEFATCDTCPVYSDDYGTCLIQKERPEDWELIDTDAPWRAFKQN